jgi:hypothetical protein
MKSNPPVRISGFTLVRNGLALGYAFVKADEVLHESTIPAMRQAIR